ncbi:MAG: sugar ABC transporter permease [Polyangiaceae bacterium]
MKPRSPRHPLFLGGPTAALLVVFFVAPVIVAAIASFYDWDLLTPPRFVGFANYVELAEGGELLGTAARTLGFSAIVVSASTSLGLGLALLLHRKGAVFAAARSAIFSAYVVSWVAVALLWLWLLDPDAGLVAKTLAGLGLGRFAFLTEPRAALVTLALVTVWKNTGYALVIFLGALDAVPKSLLEAAALDGANAIRRFWHVIVPELRPTLGFVSTTSLVVSFQAFDVVRIMTQGGPAKGTTLFVYAIYEQIFLNLSVGKASALVVLFFALLLALSALQLRVFRARGGTAS